MSVQSAYLASLRGDWEGSKKTLEGIVGNEAQKDPVTLAVSHNNLIAVKSRFLDVDAVTGMVSYGLYTSPLFFGGGEFL